MCKHLVKGYDTQRPVSFQLSVAAVFTSQMEFDIIYLNTVCFHTDLFSVVCISLIVLCSFYLITKYVKAAD